MFTHPPTGQSGFSLNFQTPGENQVKFEHFRCRPTFRICLEHLLLQTRYPPVKNISQLAGLPVTGLGQNIYFIIIFAFKLLLFINL